MTQQFANGLAAINLRIFNVDVVSYLEYFHGATEITIIL